MSDNFIEAQDSGKFLIYQLGDEWFATPLTEVRAVIEYQQAKPIPHTKPYYKGVINIRGEIIGVIDLRERLGMGCTPSPVCQLVFDTHQGPLAATVDRVHSVSVLSDSDVERKAGVVLNNKESAAYFMGVGKLDGKLLTLVSLRKVAESESLTTAV